MRGRWSAGRCRRPRNPGETCRCPTTFYQPGRLVRRAGLKARRKWSRRVRCSSRTILLLLAVSRSRFISDLLVDFRRLRCGPHPLSCCRIVYQPSCPFWAPWTSWALPLRAGCWDRRSSWSLLLLHPRPPCGRHTPPAFVHGQASQQPTLVFSPIFAAEHTQTRAQAFLLLLCTIACVYERGEIVRVHVCM